MNTFMKKIVQNLPKRVTQKKHIQNLDVVEKSP